MSIEKCPNCGQLFDGATCECGYKHNVRVTKVTIDRSPELEALRAEKEEIKRQLDEKNAILAQTALAEYEKEKSTIMDMLSESNLSYDQKAEIEDKLQDPKNLEVVKGLITALTGKTKKTPYGKAPFVQSGGGHGNAVEMLDNLYDRAYVNSSKYDKEEVAEAKQKINTLWESLLSGKSWSQLRENPKAIQQHKLSACPQCGFTLVDRSDCPNCNYDPTERQKVVKTRIFKSPDSRQF